MFVHDSKLYIFGGYSKKGYVATDLNVLELNPKTAKDLNDEQIEMDERMKR